MHQVSELRRAGVNLPAGYEDQFVLAHREFALEKHGENFDPVVFRASLEKNLRRSPHAKFDLDVLLVTEATPIGLT